LSRTDVCRAPGRRAAARAILRQWAGAVSGGMLPNRFDEGDATPEYNSVDAALWFIIAADAYLAGHAAPADRELPRAAIARLVDGHPQGTRRYRAHRGRRPPGPAPRTPRRRRRPPRMRRAGPPAHLDGRQGRRRLHHP